MVHPFSTVQCDNSTDSIRFLRICMTQCCDFSYDLQVRGDVLDSVRIRYIWFGMMFYQFPQKRSENIQLWFHLILSLTHTQTLGRKIKPVRKDSIARKCNIERRTRQSRRVIFTLISVPLHFCLNSYNFSLERKTMPRASLDVSVAGSPFPACSAPFCFAFCTVRTSAHSPLVMASKPVSRVMRDLAMSQSGQLRVHYLQNRFPTTDQSKASQI